MAGCTLLMMNQVCQLLLHTKPGLPLAGFLFFSTLCSYSFHWYLTTGSLIPSPRIEWLKKNRPVHAVLFFAGLAGSVYFFWFLRESWQFIVPAVLATFLYSAPKIPHPLFHALRRVAIGKTIFLSLTWMYVTTILPVVISRAPWKADFTFFAAGRFFFIYSICILFDFRDRADDKANGIRSLITYFDEKGIRNLFVFSLFIFISTSLALLAYDYSPLSVCLLIIPAIITGLLYNYARKNFSDWLYYFALDGLLALSPLLMLVTGI